MDPSRLVDTTWVGLERELLRSAREEVAPNAVRMRVHQAVGAVLASSTSAPAPRFADSAPAAIRRDAVASPGYRDRSASAPRSGPARLALALKSVHAVYLRLVRISSPAG